MGIRNADLNSSLAIDQYRSFRYPFALDPLESLRFTPGRQTFLPL